MSAISPRTFVSRTIALRTTIVVLIAAVCLLADSKKQAEDQRVELLRGLSAEYATIKAYLPRSKRPLDVDSDGNWDKKAWEQIGRALGPAGRVGDMIQVTRIKIEKDAIILEMNNGVKSHFLDKVQVDNGGPSRPINNNPGEAGAGTSIVVPFSGGIAGVTSADVKKLLKPLLDFSNGSVTEQYIEELPAELKQAVHDKKAVEGMNRDQVLLAVGRPNRKVRETVDGV